MEIKIIEREFSVCQVEDYLGVNLESRYVFTGKTHREKSLVCPTRQVPSNTLRREDGWRAMVIRGVLDFSLVGILAKIANVLADKDISIFALSTYNTDYILIKKENLQKAVKALRDAGYTVTGE